MTKLLKRCELCGGQQFALETPVYTQAGFKTNRTYWEEQLHKDNFGLCIETLRRRIEDLEQAQGRD